MEQRTQKQNRSERNSVDCKNAIQECGNPIVKDDLHGFSHCVNKDRRSGIVIMGQLIGLIKPLLPIMCVAILLGVLGYLCAIFLPILAGYGLIGGLIEIMQMHNLFGNVWRGAAIAPGVLGAILVLLAVLRGASATAFKDAKVQKVSFAYENKPILQDVSIEFPKGKIVGIHGLSGCGKSTLLKLLMRFWDADRGSVCISGKNVKEINTTDLRNMQSYVTQETYLFHDSIANNIAVGKPDASREEIMEAAKKASVHEFIMTLPNGYDTQVGELGDTLSGGERQRIGIARAFLHDAPFLLLDEPTSNLDALNEGIILKSLQETCEEKAVVLVSHRASTMKLADVVCEMGERDPCY